MKRATLLTVSFFTVVLMASSAKASVIYSLDFDHFGGAGAAPYGTITLTNVVGSPGQVDMTVALTNSNEFVLTGQTGSTVAFNVIGNPTLSLLSSSLPGWSLDSTTAGVLPASGFGSFEYSLNCCFSANGGANSQAGPVTLRLSGTGLSETSFAELSNLPPGDTRAFFAVDIISPTGATGFVGSTSTPTERQLVPEPGTLLLFGLGLTAVGSWMRKRKSA